MKKNFVALVATAAMLLIIGPAANALPTLRLSDGITTVTVTDNLAGDLNSTSGVVLVSTSFGAWSVLIEVGTSKPALGTALAPQMDLATSANISTSPGTLVVSFSDNDFGPLAAGYNFAASIGGTAGGTLTYNTYFDAGNTLFGKTTPLTSQTFGPGAFSGTAFSTVALPGSGAFPYSLTQEWIINHGVGVLNTTGDSTLTAVPEPSALLLLGSGISVLGLIRLRKRT